MDFGNRSLTASDGTPMTVATHAVLIKVGLNYRLDVLPILAKYLGRSQILAD